MCAASAGRVWVWRVVMVAIMLFIGYSASAQSLKRGSIRSVTDGVLIDKPDSVEQARLDSLANIPDELKKISEKQAKRLADSLSRVARRKERARELGRLDENGNIIPREPWFSD